MARMESVQLDRIRGAEVGYLIGDSIPARLSDEVPEHVRTVRRPAKHRAEARTGDCEDSVTLNAMQEELCNQSRWDFSDLRALFVNCTLKRSPEISNTEGLASISMEIMRRQGVTVESIRAIDRNIATGVWPDMTEHGWEHDEWPAITEQVMAADILVLCTPIWLGEKSSVCTKIVERLYGNSHLLNDEGQYAYYGQGGWMSGHR